MTAAELRTKLMDRIDALLARPFLIWGEDRRLLSAVRGYVAVMPEAELQRLNTFMIQQETPQ